MVIFFASLQFDKMPSLQKKISLLNYVSLFWCQIHSPFKQEVMFWKTSSPQGMVRPPIG